MNESFHSWGGGAGTSAIAIALPLAIMIIILAAGWTVFRKADKPGWAIIVPIYNVIVMLDVVNRPIWWILLMFIPVVNAIIGILITVDLAKSFGKDIGFAIGLILLPIIFLPILAFGSAQYQRIQR